MDKTIQEQIVKLQQAIAAQESLRSTLGDPVVDEMITVLREKLESLQPAHDAERKLITCLFCDVVGSTRVASDRDPEEVLHIIDGALQTMSAAVEVFGGTVARYMGDGMLALFGAPRALERHAEQAIRAGLEIQARIAVYAREVADEHHVSDFKVRVGINSGYAVGGQVAGAQGEYTVIGDTVNIASRFESAAPPGGVLVGESTYRLAGGEALFEAEAWQPIEVKGSPEPQAVYQVLSARPQVGQQPAAVARAPLTGRDAEIKKLKERFKKAFSDRQPHVVAVIGPAGIGKTRLRLEFGNWLGKSYPDAQVWLGRAFSYSSNTPYALVSDLLKSALGIVETDSADQRRARLEAGCLAAGDLTTENLHGLAAILSLEYPGDSLASLEPEARRSAIFEAFATYCARSAARRTLALILEDTHWADENSFDLLEHVFRALTEVPLFILMATRPDHDPQARMPALWARVDPARYTEIALRDLTPTETNRVVRALLGSATIPDALIETITDTTQGNPFFIEEVINTLIEDGALRRVDGDWQLTRAVSDIHVPDTVQGVLAARIDRLGYEEKHVLQHAAIVGRIFWQQLLTDLLNSDVDGHLAHLGEREFIRRLGRAALVEDWEWIFRHVLVQEVAYDSVLKEIRRQVHRQVAEWLDARAADRLDELAPTLAYHYEQGQVWDKAIASLTQAANRAKGLFAMRDALRFYDQALALAEAHPDVVEPDTVLRLREGRGGARALAGEFDGAVADLQAVRGAVHAAGDAVWERALLSELGMIYRRLDDYDQSKALLREALDLARDSGDQRGAADILYHLGTVAWSEGENAEATAYHQEAVDICRTLGLTDLVAVQALHGRAEAYWLSGRPDMAAQFYAESLDLARQIGDRSYEAENLQMMAGVNTGNTGSANLRKASALAEDSLAMAQAAKMEWHVAPALMTLGIALGEAGDYAQGIAHLEECARFAESHGAQRFVSITLAWLGSLLLDLNLLEKADSTLSKGNQAAFAIGGGFWLPNLQSSLAIAHLRQGHLDVGLQLQEAYNLAKSRGQELHMLGCLEGLAELAVAQGQADTALGYADEMLALANLGGMRQSAASAHRWRGEALLASKAYEAAEAELKRAAEMAEDIGRVRLSWDAHAALARLYRAQGHNKLAAKHNATVRKIVKRIADNLQDAELRAGLPEFD